SSKPNSRDGHPPTCSTLLSGATSLKPTTLLHSCRSASASSTTTPPSSKPTSPDSSRTSTTRHWLPSIRAHSIRSEKPPASWTHACPIPPRRSLSKIATPRSLHGPTDPTETSPTTNSSTASSTSPTTTKPNSSSATRK